LIYLDVSGSMANRMLVDMIFLGVNIGLVYDVYQEIPEKY